MKLAIMQPYFFPYLGYYQLVNAVDCFVFFDDVNFINKGWINRNHILQQGKASLFTVPLLKASQNKPINEIQLIEFAKWKNNFLKTIQNSYKKAPYFNSVYAWLVNFLGKEYAKISELSCDSVSFIANLLDMDTKFTKSSAINYTGESDQNGEQKVIAICKLLEAQEYLNPRNGSALYDKQKFSSQNIGLKFIHMQDIFYKQLNGSDFVPNLSILDVLMFNSPQETKQLLTHYKLL